MLISEIKSQIDIAEVISAAGVKLKQRGTRLFACCPLHDDRTPSFIVFPDKQRWHCFGACSCGGDVIDFVQKYYRVDFQGALKHLGVGGGKINMKPAERTAIARAREKSEMKLACKEWRARKITYLSLCIRLANQALMAMKDKNDLDRIGEVYHGLAIWQYELDILLFGTKWEQWDYLKADTGYRLK